MQIVNLGLFAGGILPFQAKFGSDRASSCSERSRRMLHDDIVFKIQSSFMAASQGQFHRSLTTESLEEIIMTVHIQAWMGWALLAAVFASLTAILAKLGVDEVHPDFAMLIRTVCIAMVLGPLLLITGRTQALQTVSPRGWIFLFLSAAATGASWLCYFRALKLGEASKVASVDKLSVVLVAIIATTLLGERLGPSAWAGVLLVTIGISLIGRG